MTAFVSIAAVACPYRVDPAHAATKVYAYQVEHPRYGNIGTFTNIVRRTGNIIDVTSELHVVVEFLGITLFREDANRREHWVKKRFVGFHGVTDTNGVKIEVNGKALAKGFLIASPRGTVTAPLRIHPSNPWAAWLFDTDVMMSTSNGKVSKVVVTKADNVDVTFDGKTLRLQQFFVDSDKHQAVWFEPDGVPAAFQTSENGAVISFVLKGHGLFLP